jgi:hypothetical protein
LASDNVTVLLAVRSVFWAAYALIRRGIEATLSLGQDVIGDGEGPASQPSLRRNSDRRDIP